MITWHGLADQLIFPNGTVNYYNKVMATDPKAQDYYRFFEAPGVAHCGGGLDLFLSKPWKVWLGGSRKVLFPPRLLESARLTPIGR